ncbi:MAG: hypothetical protein EAZ47_04830 [Bacteroidetes bacterium]|jgi:hypothetical protein|nr:MAG: hypothetical protein EAY72_01900 [Bacteroidota bacterium]TAE72877.1 MAG: hypothetical protein EAY68_00065 [Bacteroidota bacterium]TAF94017.1 MAG: hypothetical protein EAZ47_04830 [Bacteroidota bacterium]
MKRNSPKQIQAADDLNRLEQIVTDKRNNKRADAKKHRRNRHYQKQFIRNALSTGVVYKNEEVGDE